VRKNRQKLQGVRAVCGFGQNRELVVSGWFRDGWFRDDPDPGASDEVIMSIAGHFSRQMLSRYTHVRSEARRKALEEIAEW